MFGGARTLGETSACGPRSPRHRQARHDMRSAASGIAFEHFQEQMPCDSARPRRLQRGGGPRRPFAAALGLGKQRKSTINVPGPDQPASRPLPAIARKTSSKSLPAPHRRRPAGIFALRRTANVPSWICSAPPSDPKIAQKQSRRASESAGRAAGTRYRPRWSSAN